MSPESYRRSYDQYNDSMSLANSLSPVRRARSTIESIGAGRSVSIVWINTAAYLPEVGIQLSSADIAMINGSESREPMRVGGIFREHSENDIYWRVTPDGRHIVRLVNMSQRRRDKTDTSRPPVLLWDDRLSGVVNSRATHHDTTRHTSSTIALTVAVVVAASWASSPTLAITDTAPVVTRPSSTPSATTQQPTPSSTEQAKSAALHVATWNIRATRLSKSSWDEARREAVLGYIKTVDIMALQETQRQLTNTKKQIKASDNSEQWLTNELAAVGYERTTPTVSPRYGSHAVDNGEDRVLFWRESKFDLIKQGNETLPNHRDLPWAELRDKQSGRKFFVMTTHLSHGGSTSRYSSVRGAQIGKILDFTGENMSDTPVIFLGDMNSLSGGKEDRLIQSTGFKDAFAVAALQQNLRYGTTVSNFTGGLSGTIHKKSGWHIDHIYVDDNGSDVDTVVRRVEIVPQKGTDHLPVEADITLQAP